MVKAEWGAKHLCKACGARFYDLKRDPIACPKCGTIREPEAQKPRRPARPDPKTRNAAQLAAAAADRPGAVKVSDAYDKSREEKASEDGAGGADVEGTDDEAAEEDDDLIEDASELGDGDVTEVVGGTDDDDDDQR